MADPNARKLEQVEKLLGEADERSSELESQDRSVIAKRVIWLYIAIVSACFAFVLVIFWFLTPCANANATACVAWEPPAEFLLKVLTTAVLPIVTLVLGYYFGTAKADDAG